MEIIVNAMEENPSREKIVKIWKDYAVLDAIVVTETSVKRNFLGVSVAKTPCSQCRGPRFDPYSGNQILDAAAKSLHVTTKDSACLN